MTKSDKIAHLDEQKREICKAYAFGYDVAAITEIEGVTEVQVQSAINEGKVEGVIDEIKNRGEE